MIGMIGEFLYEVLLRTVAVFLFMVFLILYHYQNGKEGTPLFC
jgi:hypothetical protein